MRELVKTFKQTAAECRDTAQTLENVSIRSLLDDDDDDDELENPLLLAEAAAIDMLTYIEESTIHQLDGYLSAYPDNALSERREQIVEQLNFKSKRRKRFKENDETGRRLRQIASHLDFIATRLSVQSSGSQGTQNHFNGPVITNSNVGGLAMGKNAKGKGSLNR